MIRRLLTTRFGNRAATHSSIPDEPEPVSAPGPDGVAALDREASRDGPPSGTVAQDALLLAALDEEPADEELAGNVFSAETVESDPVLPDGVVNPAGCTAVSASPSGDSAPRAAEQVVTLFSGADVGLRHNRGTGTTCWITLTGLGRNRSGFGEDLFAKRGIPAIYFINVWDHWWQTPEMRQVVEIAKQVVRDQGYRNLVLYSASMGGYGAALLSGELDADCLIVIAPQVTIDPEKPPYDSRWRKEFTSIRFQDDDLLGRVSKTARKFVIYDAFDPDRHHAALYATLPNTTLINVPFGAHTPGFVLNETGILRPLIFDFAEGRYNSARFRREFREKRVQSRSYLKGMSRAIEARHPETAWCVLKRAAELAPPDAGTLVQYSALLKRQDKPAEALEAGEQAVAADPRDKNAATHLISMYAEADRLDDAERVTRNALEVLPRNADIWRAYSVISFRQGKADAAIEQAEQAVSLAPGDVRSLSHLAGILMQTRREGDAYQAALRGLVFDPHEANCLRIGAAMAKAIGRKEEARALARRGLAIIPANPVFNSLVSA